MRLTIFANILTGLILAFTSLAQAQAEAVRRYASIVVDADTLEVIHARQIDAKRFPASLTKVMTLYLTFDALNAGHLTLNQPLKISNIAAKTPPVRIGLKAGQTLTVSEAIQALTVRSANDAAVVLAEALGGSEANFAKMMTDRAQSLGMISTQFHNANGLPHAKQETTARDMAKLAMAILNNHRRYYHYFGQKTFTYKGRTYKNTNSLLHNMPEVDGFKTGYTHASGYNLIISAQQDGRRIIAVVLGGATGKARNQHMRDLISRGFVSIGLSPTRIIAPIKVVKTTEEEHKPTITKKPLPDLTDKRQIKASLPTHVLRLRGRDNKTVTITSTPLNVKLPPPGSDKDWSIEIGVFASQDLALDQLTALLEFSGHRLTQENGLILPYRTEKGLLYRARFGQLTYDEAQQACQSMKNLAKGCFVVVSAT